jgi:hypothetical protein
MPIVQYWDGGEPPGYVAELLATFRARNPGMEHLLFDEPAADDFIAERFGDRELAAFRACAVPAMRADYFRYCAIHALGGVYADVSLRCIAPLSGPLGEGGGTLFRRDPHDYLLNGFFLFDSPCHPLLRLALDVATTNVERRPAEMVQMVTGPWIFSSLFVLHRLSLLDPPGESGGGEELEGLAEPFRRDVGTLAPTAAGRRGTEPMVAPLFEAVGSRDRIEKAFEGVRVAPFERMNELVEEPDGPLPYKGDEMDWIDWQRRGQTIFR